MKKRWKKIGKGGIRAVLEKLPPPLLDGRTALGKFLKRLWRVKKYKIPGVGKLTVLTPRTPL